MDEDKPESSTPESAVQDSPEAASPRPEENHTEDKENHNTEDKPEPCGEKRPLEEEPTQEEAPQEEEQQNEVVVDGHSPAEEETQENKITPTIIKVVHTDLEKRNLEPKLKKRKWGGKITATEEESIVISSDSLKSLIAEPEPAQPPTQEQETPQEPVEEEVTTAPAEVTTEEASEAPRHYFPEPVRAAQPEVQPRGLPARNHQEMLPKRNELLVNTEPKSPARHPVSPIVSLQNLVRPFTLGQLKDMLGRFGTLVDEGFWIDRIKSKCYVTYSNEEEAQKARDVLHHSRWPASNPKTLAVDFATRDELEFHIRLTEPQRLPPPPSSPKRSASPKPKKASVEREETNSKPVLREKPLREWDIGKVLQEPSSPSKPKQNKEKKGDHTETQLLDNLFRKTKATPFIYWLPLSEEEATKKEAEHKTAERRRWVPNDDHPPRAREDHRHHRDRSRSPLPRRC